MPSKELLAVMLCCSGSIAWASDRPLVGMKQMLDVPICQHEGREMACGEILAFVPAYVAVDAKKRLVHAVKDSVLSAGGEVVSTFSNLGAMRFRFNQNLAIDTIIGDLKRRFPGVNFYPNYIQGAR